MLLTAAFHISYFMLPHFISLPSAEWAQLRRASTTANGYDSKLRLPATVLTFSEDEKVFFAISQKATDN